MCCYPSRKGELRAVFADGEVYSFSLSYVTCLISSLFPGLVGKLCFGCQPLSQCSYFLSRSEWKKTGRLRPCALVLDVPRVWLYPSAALLCRAEAELGLHAILMASSFAAPVSAASSVLGKIYPLCWVAVQLAARAAAFSTKSDLTFDSLHSKCFLLRAALSGPLVQLAQLLAYLP